MYNVFFYTYLAFSGIAAILSISMWIDYFRRIDVFNREKITHLAIALFIGCFTPFLSIGIYRVIHYLGFNLNGNFYNDLIYTIFAIGANEELSKLLGVIIVFKILKKHIEEPIDYLIYAGVTALGFSVVENYKYFNNYGIQIISTRAFYSALVHIINTTIIVYGYFRLQLFSKGKQNTNTLVAILVSISSHGLFDFFLINNFLGPVTPFFSTIVYLIGINFWVQMLNNANNYSQNFSYEKIHFSSNIFYRLLFWYLTTLSITILYNMILFDSKRALNYFFSSLSEDGFLLFIVILRASRFKIYHNKYFDIKIELPFYFTKNDDEDFKLFYLFPIKIRGESSHEYKLTTYLNKKIDLFKLSKSKEPTIEVTLSDKLLLNDDVVVYKAVTNEDQFFLKPKTYGETETEDENPISGLYKLVDSFKNKAPENLSFKDLEFIDWVYIK